MTGWMKCPSGWMDDGTDLGEASFNIHYILSPNPKVAAT